MSDGRDDTIHHDKYGQEYTIDEKGNHRKPMKSKENPVTSSGFRTYDDSKGHCGLCGRLDCNGGCFK